MLAYFGDLWEMPKGNFGNLIDIFTASWVGYGENEADKIVSREWLQLFQS